MNVRDIYNTAGRYNISDDEAARIAGTVNNEQEFTDVWENTDWWTDTNNNNTSKGS